VTSQVTLVLLKLGSKKARAHIGTLKNGKREKEAQKGCTLHKGKFI
jgi:hypothetical protein